MCLQYSHRVGRVLFFLFSYLVIHLYLTLFPLWLSYNFIQWKDIEVLISKLFFKYFDRLAHWIECEFQIFNVIILWFVNDFVSIFYVFSKRRKKVTLLFFYHRRVSKRFISSFSNLNLFISLHITKISLDPNFPHLKQMILEVWLKSHFSHFLQVQHNRPLPKEYVRLPYRDVSQREYFLQSSGDKHFYMQKL